MSATPTPVTIPAGAALNHGRRPLEAFFAPKNVAVIGATESQGTVGRTILWNLITSQFGGTVYPVNLKRSSVLGIKAYPNIKAVPEQVDLAVIITPATAVPNLINECVEANIKSCVIISAGFKEIGPAGVELERQVLENARRGGMRVIGPNCLGVMCPLTGLNATFATTIARPGNVGFLSQSGALCTAVLDWSLQENVGFSAFMSIGSMLDVGWGDLIHYLGDDPRTESIVIYMESIGDARSFLSAAREVALTKPIIVIKAGRSEAAAKAAASHTGSLTGSDEVLDAAFRRCGVLRVNSIAEIFSMSEVLAKQPRPQGPRLTIVTNAGGPGVLATDELVAGGGELAKVSKETMEALNPILPAAWSHNNPIDVIGDASPERYAKSLEIVLKDQESDGVMVILTPQAMTDPTQTAEHLKPYAKMAKPILASWMGGADVEAGRRILARAGIPSFDYPDTAAQAFNYMWRYAYNLRGIYETPSLPVAGSDDAPDRAAAEKIISAVRKEGRTILTEFESKNLLAAYGIPTVTTLIAKTEAEAVKLAEKIGYPIVLKLYSETITHKTDVGGVQLNLRTADAVKKAFQTIKTSVAKKAKASDFLGVTVQPMIKLEGYEIIIGSSLDPQFGPVLLFGTGGQLVEVFKDRALALPPLNTTLARRMMEQTKIYTALKGVRGRKAVNMAALEQLMVRFSQLVVEQRWIKEIDINPLLASPEQLVALDARVVVHGSKVTVAQLPQAAIRPYPIQYVSPWKTKKGAATIIRPIRPEDEPLLVDFHKSLSERSVFLRYFQALQLSQRVTHERLTRICFNDYDRELALVVERKDAAKGAREVIGVGRMIKPHGSNTGEIVVVVSDLWQGQGMGKELSKRLIQIARDEKLSRLEADMLTENVGMQAICKQLGFKVTKGTTEPAVHATLDL